MECPICGIKEYEKEYCQFCVQEHFETRRFLKLPYLDATETTREWLYNELLLIYRQHTEDTTT